MRAPWGHRWVGRAALACALALPARSLGVPRGAEAYGDFFTGLGGALIGTLAGSLVWVAAVDADADARRRALAMGLLGLGTGACAGGAVAAWPARPVKAWGWPLLGGVLGGAAGGAVWIAACADAGRGRCGGGVGALAVLGSAALAAAGAEWARPAREDPWGAWRLSPGLGSAVLSTTW